MKRVSRALVTGGAGFVGSHIVDELIRRGIETIVIDDFSTGSRENLKMSRGSRLLTLLEGDIRQVWNLLSGIEGIDVVFHEAAIASVQRSVSQPLEVHDANVNATLNLLNYCTKTGVKRFVFASSAAVYGAVRNPPASEELVCIPASPYGASKIAVENYLSAFHSTYGLETVALRYFNIYGARQRLDDYYSGVITVFARKLLRRSAPTIYGDGKQTRDFVNIHDIVQANMLAMESREAVGEVFNVASGRSVRILELLDTMVAMMGIKKGVRPLFAPSRAGDVRVGTASISKIREKLGYTPKVRLEDGLREVLEYIGKMERLELVGAGGTV